jgi:hypothetical protein
MELAAAEADPRSDTTGLPLDVCESHFDEIRLCSLAWKDDSTTPWGDAGPLGCLAVTPIELICGG